MIASICDRCGAVVEASGDDSPLAFYAQVDGEDAVVMDDLCPSCMEELRSMLEAFASNEHTKVNAENETVSKPTDTTGQDAHGPTVDKRETGAEDVLGRGPERPVERSQAYAAPPHAAEPVNVREMPRRVGTHSFSIPKTGKYVRSQDQS